jgi:hypothetical protein
MALPSWQVMIPGLLGIVKFVRRRFSSIKSGIMFLYWMNLIQIVSTEQRNTHLNHYQSDIAGAVSEYWYEKSALQAAGHTASDPFESILKQPYTSDVVDRIQAPVA